MFERLTNTFAKDVYVHDNEPNLKKFVELYFKLFEVTRERYESILVDFLIFSIFKTTTDIIFERITFVNEQSLYLFLPRCRNSIDQHYMAF